MENKVKCDLCRKEIVGIVSVICNINFCEECRKDFEIEMTKSEIIRTSIEAGL